MASTPDNILYQILESSSEYISDTNGNELGAVKEIEEKVNFGDNPKHQNIYTQPNQEKILFEKLQKSLSGQFKLLKIPIGQPQHNTANPFITSRKFADCERVLP